MMKLKQVYQNPQTRMKAVIIALVIVVLVSGGFILWENTNSQNYFVEVYQSQQQKYTNQLANQLELAASAGMNETELVTCFEERVEVSGSSWSFLCRDDIVLFAKDQKTTETLRESKDRTTFLENIEEQNLIFTSAVKRLDGNMYMVGTVTDKNYALSKGQIPQHEIHLYLLLAILIILGVMSIIGITSKLNQIERELLDTSDILQRQNQKLEKAGEELADSAEEEVAVAEESAEKNFYDSDLIRMFLKKSNDVALMPMQIMFIDIIMENRYYSRQEIFDVVTGLKAYLKDTHVTGEIRRGSFVVLMYKTTYEEAIEIQKQSEIYGQQVKKEKEICLRVRVLEVKDGAKAEAVYEEGLK